MRRASWAALCIMAMLVSTAAADVGSLNLSVTPVTVPGSLDVDLDLTATTTGALSQASSDYVYMFGLLYYPFPYSPAGTFLSEYDSTVYRTGTSNVFDRTFSFTLPFGGTWGTYGFVYGLTYRGASTSTSVYGVVNVLEAGPVPTMTLPGIALLGALLAGIGVLILRRA